MKYNDYIILTDEDYNNMKTKFHHLDELDKEKLLDIYNKMMQEYKDLESNGDSRYIGILQVSKKHIDLLKNMLTDSGVEVVDTMSDKECVPKSPYYHPLRRIFKLGRPMPRPPRPPYNPVRNGLDLVDLLLLYLITRPHSRFASNICSMAHERIEALNSIL